MDLALIFEKANNDLKSKKREEYKQKHKNIIEKISKKISRKLMNKVYDYLTSIKDEALPRMFISNHEEFKSNVLNEWNKKVEPFNIDYICK